MAVTVGFEPERKAKAKLLLSLRETAKTGVRAVTNREPKTPPNTAKRKRPQKFGVFLFTGGDGGI